MNLGRARLELGIGPDTAWPDVKRAYRRRMLAVHSDTVGSVGADPRVQREAHAASQVLVEAYEVVCAHYGHAKGSRAAETTAAEEQRHLAEMEAEAARAEARLAQVLQALESAEARLWAAHQAVTATAGRLTAARNAAEVRDQQARIAEAQVDDAERMLTGLYGQIDAARAMLAAQQASTRRSRWRTRRRRLGIVAAAVLVLLLVGTAAEATEATRDRPAPRNVTADTDPTAVIISWTGAAPGATGFEIRADGYANAAYSLTVPADTHTGRWALPKSGDTYCFRVRAVRDGSGHPAGWAHTLEFWRHGWTAPWTRNWVAPWSETWVGAWSPAQEACVTG